MNCLSCGDALAGNAPGVADGGITTATPCRVTYCRWHPAMLNRIAHATKAVNNHDETGQRDPAFDVSSLRCMFGQPAPHIFTHRRHDLVRRVVTFKLDILSAQPQTFFVIGDPRPPRKKNLSPSPPANKHTSLREAEQKNTATIDCAISGQAPD